MITTGAEIMDWIFFVDGQFPVSEVSASGSSTTDNVLLETADNAAKQQDDGLAQDLCTATGDVTTALS